MQHFSRAILKIITTLFGTSVPPALPKDHENTSKASRAFTLRPHLSAMRLGADVQLAFVRVDSAKDRDRRAILKKITTLFGTSVPPALPNDHENTLKASMAFTLRPHLSAMRLGAGLLLALVLVDSAKDRDRRAILKKITTLFGTSVPPTLPNAMENCARCDWGLTTLPGEVNVRFIVLLSLFWPLARPCLW
jgi:hypothetical protein